MRATTRAASLSSLPSSWCSNGWSVDSSARDSSEAARLRTVWAAERVGVDGVFRELGMLVDGGRSRSCAASVRLVATQSRGELRSRGELSVSLVTKLRVCCGFGLRAAGSPSRRCRDCCAVRKCCTVGEAGWRSSSASAASRDFEEGERVECARRARSDMFLERQ